MLASSKALAQASCTCCSCKKPVEALADLQRLLKARLPNNSAIPRCSLATAAQS